MNCAEAIKNEKYIKCNSYDEFRKVLHYLSNEICSSKDDLLSDDFIALFKDYTYPLWVLNSKNYDGLCWTDSKGILYKKRVESKFDSIDFTDISFD